MAIMAKGIPKENETTMQQYDFFEPLDIGPLFILNAAVYTLLWKNRGNTSNEGTKQYTDSYLSNSLTILEDYNLKLGDFSV